MRSLLHFNDSINDPIDIDVVCRSSIFLSRNLADTPFPWRSSLPQLSESRRRIMQAVKNRDPRFSFQSMEDMPREAIHFALERGFLAESVSANGAGAFALSEDALSTVLVNAREHVCFGSHRCGRLQRGNLESLLAFESSLDAELPWAFAPGEGYIQTNPDETGTGLHYSCRVFIPAIVSAGIWERVARGLVVSGMQVARASCEDSDLQVDSEGPESAWIDIVYKAEPGQSEIDSFNVFQSSMEILCDTERKARKRQMDALPPVSLDRLWRSLALLRSARLLEESEAHILLSRLRFGVLLKVLPAPDIDKIVLLVDKLNTLYSNYAIKTAKSCNCIANEDILETQTRADSMRAAIVDHFPPL